MTCPDAPLMLIGRSPGEDGSYGRAAPDAPLPRNPMDASLWLPSQGQANSCGTTTLSYVLLHLLGSSAPTRPEIDNRLRRGNIFSAPLLLVAYARKLGLAARTYNDASLELLFGFVDREIPVMVLTDTTPLNLQDTAALHWVAVVAHCADRVAIYNPHGFQEELDLESFQDHWRQARIFGLSAWRSFAVAIAPRGTALPAQARPALSLIGANMAADGVAGVVNRAVGIRQQLADDKAALTRLPLEAAGVLLSAAQTVAGGAVLLASAATGGLAGLYRRGRP